MCVPILRLVAVFIGLMTMAASSEIVGLETKSLKSGDDLEPSSRPYRLIVMRFCPWCERVLLILARKNISVEVVNVNLVDKPEFLFEKHPEGKVPVLEHNNQVIIDSGLIAEYLDWTDAVNPVMPADPYLKAKQRMIASQLESKVPAAVRAIIEGQKSPEKKETAVKMVHEALDAAEKLLADDFYGGEEPGFSDYMTYPFVERIWIWTNEPDVTGLKIEAFPCDCYPKLQRWFSNMRSRIEVTMVTQPLSRHRLFNKGYVAGNPDYDAGLDLPKND